MTVTTPGVYSSTSVRAGASGAADIEAATWYISGLTERGLATEPVLIRSMAEYAEQFGDRVTYGSLYDACMLHFQEGGGRIAVRRVVGPAATTGMLVLKDRGSAGGADTLRVTALSPGAWSGRVSISTAVGSVADSVTFSVYYDGQLVERYADVPSIAALVVALSRSAYVRGVNLASAGATPLPADLAATVLSSGTDDRTSVTAAMLVAALPTVDTIRDAGGQLLPAGGGCCSIPGQTADTVGVLLAAYASANDRVALVTLAPGSTAAQSAAAARTLTATTTPAGTAQDGGFISGAVICPAEGGGTRLQPAEGYVAAKRALAIAAAGGPWQFGAGAISAARWVLGVDQTYTPAELTLLEQARTIPLKTVLGQVRIYGLRSLSSDEANWRSLKDSDVVNYVDVMAKRGAEDVNFATSDGAGGRALGKLKAAVVAVVEPMAQAGAFYPAPDGSDEGWVVDTSGSVNTAASLAAGELRVVVGVRPAPTASIIRITIVKAAPTASL